jgi:outer membrane protein OmpA-like peptidoglycan-associated protein
MKKYKALIFLFCLICCGILSASRGMRKADPELDKLYKEAEISLKNENILQALNLYTELLAKDPKNSNLFFKLGYCYLKVSKANSKALYFLQKASTRVSSKYKEGSVNEKKAPLLTYKLLGDAYHQQGQFDLAIVSYERFRKILLSSRKKNYDDIDEIERQIEMCRNAKKLVAAPLNVKIKNMGRNVNSPFPDYSPVFTADQNTLIFTSARSTNIGGKTYDGGKYFEDIYTASKTDSGWSKAVNIGPPINTIDNEASVCISADGQEILIYKDDKGDGNIYSTSLKGTKWTVPVKLNSHINSKWWEPSAFISADGTALYFTSDRPGGYGGRDIYKSEKKANGDWGKAVNLGETINTEYDEDAPFIHPDGVTLFFSSKGHSSMGGFDIFESTVSDGKWSTPENVGYPINSPGDDVFYVVSPDKKIAYFTSLREGGYGEKDNYSITFPDPKESALTLQKGTVVDDDQNAPKDIKITITDNNTDEVVGVYHPNSATGKYLFILTPGKSNNIYYEAEGFLFYSENKYIAKEDSYREVTKSVKLAPIAVGSKVVLNNIFFDFDKADLRKSSNVELNRLYDFLVKHPNLAVEISGYTDSKGTDDYNNKLSTDRALAVTEFLVSKGISKERLTAVGCGKSDPIAPNEKTDGSDDPSGRQLNRRVELKITDIR